MTLTLNIRGSFCHYIMKLLSLHNENIIGQRVVSSSRVSHQPAVVSHFSGVFSASVGRDCWLIEWLGFFFID